MTAVTFSLTEDDHAVLGRAAARRRVAWFAAWLFALLAVTNGPALVTFGVTPAWQPLAMWVAAVLFGLRNAQTAHAEEVRRNLRDRPWLLREQHLELTPAGVRWRTLADRGEVAWRFVGAVEESRAHVILRTGPTQAFLVPKRAFPTPAGAAAFARAAREHLAAPATAPVPEPEIGAERSVWSLRWGAEGADFTALHDFVLEERRRRAGASVGARVRRFLTVVIAAGVTLLLAIGLVFGTNDVMWVTAIGWLAVLTVLLFRRVFVRPFLWLTLWRLRRRWPLRFTTATQVLHAGPAGLVHRTEHGVTEATWSAITGVGDTGRHVFLFLGPSTAYVVPYRAFPDAAAAARFAEQARGWLDGAPRLAEAATARGEAPATANPFAPPK